MQNKWLDPFGRSIRFSVAKKEAFLSLTLALAYFFWWYLTAYSFGSGPVRRYSYIMGFPTWFFLSCIVGFVLFSLLAFLMVKVFFREITLEEGDEKGGAKNG